MLDFGSHCDSTVYGSHLYEQRCQRHSRHQTNHLHTERLPIVQKEKSSVEKHRSKVACRALVRLSSAVARDARATTSHASLPED
jgi:hypothetical protein